MRKEIVQHNFTSYKPESIFTTYLDKEDIKIKLIKNDLSVVTWQINQVLKNYTIT